MHQQPVIVMVTSDRRLNNRPMAFLKRRLNLQDDLIRARGQKKDGGDNMNQPCNDCTVDRPCDES